MYEDRRDSNSASGEGARVVYDEIYNDAKQSGHSEGYAKMLANSFAGQKMEEYFKKKTKE